jgi:hypothetical protein
MAASECGHFQRHQVLESAFKKPRPVPGEASVAGDACLRPAVVWKMMPPPKESGSREALQAHLRSTLQGQGRGKRAQAVVSVAMDASTTQRVPCSTSTNCFSDAQVSQPPHKKPCPYTRRSLHPPSPVVHEIVRLQRNLLDTDRGEDFDEDDSWLLAQVIREYVNPITTKRTLIV